VSERVVVGLVGDEERHGDGAVVGILPVGQDRRVVDHVDGGDGLIEGEEHQLRDGFRFQAARGRSAEASAVRSFTLIPALIQ